jgi:hypothetical protein
VRRRSDLDAVEWGPFGGRRYVERNLWPNYRSLMFSTCAPSFCHSPMAT